MQRQRFIAVAFAAMVFGAVPAAAQDTAPSPMPEAEAPPPEGEDNLGEGMDLLGRGAEMFLRGLMDEIAPELRRIQPGLRDLADELRPMLTELLALIDEIDAYHPPERLPNGDIILRRKTPMERAPEEGEGTEGEQIEI